MAPDPQDPPAHSLVEVPAGTFVTIADCKGVQLTLQEKLNTMNLGLEKRLTRLESLNAGSIIAAVATLIGMAYMLWQFFH